MMSPGSVLVRHATLAQVFGTPAEVFDLIFLVFLGLGTIVGVVVISYTVYNAYKYRAGAPDAEGRYDVEEEPSDEDSAGVARPRVGEIPTGSGKGGGKKLFVSFGISACIVLGLIVFSYSAFLHVEDTNQLYDNEDEQDPLRIDVTGEQFRFTYTYPDGTTMNELRIPKDRAVVVNVTSKDVMHNFGVRELRVKADAIPNQYNTAWFEAEETGTYEAICYELCGVGHSTMRGEEVIVMEPGEFEQWAQENLDTTEMDVEVGS
jgi:cytochrome c oxidase subunit 2